MRWARHTCATKDVQEAIVAIRPVKDGAAILRPVAAGIRSEPHLHDITTLSNLAAAR